MKDEPEQSGQYWRRDWSQRPGSRRRSPPRWQSWSRWQCLLQLWHCNRWHDPPAAASAERPRRRFCRRGILGRLGVGLGTAARTAAGLGPAAAATVLHKLLKLEDDHQDA